VTITTTSADETTALGLKLGKLLKPLDLVCLYGNLGSGKTTLTKGLARGAGYKGRVTSPTFGLAREYRSRRLTLHHLDLYRVAADQTGDIGIEDFVHDPRAACVVEWPEAGEIFFPKDRVEVRLTHAGKNRRLAFRAFGARAKVLLAGLRGGR
jgi:tRNA threonylcarbamoyladenosine biosynthesis protein TsaE